VTDPNTIEQFLVKDLGLDDGGGSIDHGLGLLESGLLDSKTIMELVVFLEDSFGISVADEELMPENFQTIDAIAAFVGHKGG